ncbi:MAG TPA: hypothetical protein VJM53_04445, partial [Burkholderiales bacterium]|nr:hypothetical protein [Burkholderiales bacterium]
MKFAWINSLALPMAAAALGLLLWPIAGLEWGLLALVLGLSWSLVLQLRNLQALSHWLRDP